MGLVQKRGWFWEDTMIEEAVGISTCTATVENNLMNVADLVNIPVGSVHFDFKTFGQPDLATIDPNLNAPGMWLGKYEIYVAYFQSNGGVGEVSLVHDPDGNVAQIDLPHGAGPQCLKMNAYILPFSPGMEYMFNDKAQGIHVYLKYVESYDSTIWPVTEYLFLHSHLD